MAVLVSNGATNLNTTNGFYRAESHNLSCFSTTSLVLSTTRTIALTYANAGNAQGIILVLGGSVTVNKDVTVTLKQSGTVRATGTLTAAQIHNGTNGSSYWCVPFMFSAPYAVTTAVGVWTVDVSQGSGTSDWVLLTSNGTAASYVAWCDNALTFADGDTIVCKDIVTITATATIKGTLGTGDAASGVSVLICKSDTPPTLTNNVMKLQVTPAATTTLTIDGVVVFGAHSGWQCGTSTTPIPTSKQLTIVEAQPTVGTNYGRKPIGPYGVLRNSIAWYGEVPAQKSYDLTAQANVGATSFSVASTTGINIGDVFFISKMADTTSNAVTYYTVTGTTSTTVSITPAIASSPRLIGAKAYRASGYGINLIRTATSGVVQYGLGVPSNFYISGVSMYVTNQPAGNSWAFSWGSLSQSGESPAYRSQWVIDNCIRGQSNYQAIGAGYVPYEGAKISNSIGFGSMLTFSNMGQSENWAVGSLELKNNYMGLQYNAGVGASTLGLATWDIQNCTFEAFGFGALKGKNCIIKNNTFRGGSGGGNQIIMQDLVNTQEWSGNTWDGTPTALRITNTNVNLVMRNEKGINSPGASSFFFLAAGTNLLNVVMENPDFVPTVSTSEQLLMIEGARLGVTNSGAVTNSDSSYYRAGIVARTGAGLSDTTVRTAGGYAMRFQPISGTNILAWSQVIPTGDITSKTMTITCWVKINNAAYYAGVHTKPTLTINYDNGTLASSVATTGTDWQQLAVTFTPATSYGQIEMKVSGATDATTTNRYFYVDDVNIAYPAGVAINLGALDLWAGGLPVEPAIATMPSITGVWDEPLSAHTIAGSAGKILKDGADNAEAAAYDMYK